MRCAAIGLVACLGCGGKSGHLGELAVWDKGPDGDEGHLLVVPFADGKNGTELVLEVLAQARAVGATGVSKFEIQVGHCVRSVIVGDDLTVQAAASTALDRITLRVRETRYRCESHVDQMLIPDEKDPESKLHDIAMVSVEGCEHEPVEHVVTRYRFEVDHAFTPPDWAMIRDWTHLALQFSLPDCFAVDATSAARIVVHTRGRGTIEPVLAPPVEPAATRAAAIVDLARRARAAVDAGDVDAGQALAVEAIVAWGDGTLIEELDDASVAAVARAIATARFVDAEPVAASLLAEAPVAITAEWAAFIGMRIDELAARYERIGDEIRLEPAGELLRAGAGRLAAIHRHVAELLDAAYMPIAASAERDKAIALDRQATGP